MSDEATSQDDAMSEENQPLASLSDAALQALLRRAFRNTLILGLISALVLLVASGWRNALMLAAGTAISAASILEWRRLVQLINARMDKQKTPRGTVTVLVFFVLRLFVFAGVIYVSLKCFHGSVTALLCGLALALLATGWEALRLLRD
jgi:uncharacterized membrane protein